MTYIKNLVAEIKDELDSAKEYAEKAIEYNAKRDSTHYKMFYDMANDELRHRGNLHNLVVSEIETISKVYTPPVEMLDSWEHAHKEYVERARWIKKMLEL